MRFICSLTCESLKCSLLWSLTPVTPRGLPQHGTGNNSLSADNSCQVLFTQAVYVEISGKRRSSPYALSLDAIQDQSLSSSESVKRGWVQSGLKGLRRGWSHVRGTSRHSETQPPPQTFPGPSRTQLLCGDSTFWGWHVYFETIMRLDLM